MTDIVQRLREQPTMSVFANMADMVGRLNHERGEAADEIERLRGWLINLRGDVLDVAGACNRLSDQIGKVLGEESDD